MRDWIMRFVWLFLLWGTVPLWAQGAASEGDPRRGRDLFLNHGFNAGGLPVETAIQMAPLLPQKPVHLPGRTGENRRLPHFLSVREVDGVPLATSTCLTCHTGELLGERVVGLGDHTADFTLDPLPMVLLARLAVHGDAERKAYLRWRDRSLGLAPYARTTTRGTNPADNFTGYLWAHRDPDSLAWRNTPSMRLPPTDVVETDVPPLWRTAKKTALYYTGGGKGDHVRLLMSALVLFTDSVEQAEEEVDEFGDMLAYLRTIEPPRYPWPIDRDLALEGRGIFEERCSPCHGTYGENPTYPNLVVDLEIIRTDPVLAESDKEFPEYLEWYNRSWYGKTSRLVETEGYVAPPLDGIWATAPYLHNGSVPTIYHLLKSGSRPRVWKRSFDSRDYDPQLLGWRFEDRSPRGLLFLSGRNGPEVYDTTRWSLSNRGHEFGDTLREEERWALLEYLKTL